MTSATYPPPPPEATAQQPEADRSQASPTEPGLKSRRWLTILGLTAVVVITVGIAFWRVHAARKRYKPMPAATTTGSGA